MAIEPNLQTRKVTVSLPFSLLNRLDRKVPRRQRSAFVAQAIEERLAIEEQAAGLEASAGAWQDSAYPDMATEADMDRWLADLRGPAYRADPDQESEAG